jgi:hypothetical protein
VGGFGVTVGFGVAVAVGVVGRVVVVGLAVTAGWVGPMLPVGFGADECAGDGVGEDGPVMADVGSAVGSGTGVMEMTEGDEPVCVASVFVDGPIRVVVCVSGVMVIEFVPVAPVVMIKGRRQADPDSARIRTKISVRQRKTLS